MPQTHGTEISFRLGPGRGDEAREIAGRLAAAASGCREHVLFADDEAGDYGCLAVWSSVEAAEAFSSSAPVADELRILGETLEKQPRVRRYVMEYQQL